MGIRINSFGIEVPGKVVRIYDEASDSTTITVDAKQAQVVHEATGAVLEFVASQQVLPLDQAEEVPEQVAPPADPPKGKAK